MPHSTIIHHLLLSIKDIILSFICSRRYRVKAGCQIHGTLFINQQDLFNDHLQACSRNYFRTTAHPKYVSGYVLVLRLFLEDLLDLETIILSQLQCSIYIVLIQFRGCKITFLSFLRAVVMLFSEDRQNEAIFSMFSPSISDKHQIPNPVGDILFMYTKWYPELPPPPSSVGVTVLHACQGSDALNKCIFLYKYYFCLTIDKILHIFTIAIQA